MIYLNSKLREQLKIGLDSASRIFQNLNGVTDDVELQFDEDTGAALAYNAAYNTHPAILHGNGPSKSHLNYLANYIPGRWSSVSGCAFCGKKQKLDLSVGIYRDYSKFEKLFDEIIFTCVNDYDIRR
ncbi:unnamed protein product [Strongylus vulgaris]|uniref:PLOD1-3-like GT domain-containing protein n=1 Tax=Strongylus vulgaris TaxID=40348 RepID=A0A3P7JKE8_STRVU|nr:unnamed protein product [Strongylus vulgaris]